MPSAQISKPKKFLFVEDVNGLERGMGSDEYCEICGITSEQLEAQGLFLKTVANCNLMDLKICIDCCFVVGGPTSEECNGCEMGKMLEGQPVLA